MKITDCAHHQAICAHEINVLTYARKAFIISSRLAYIWPVVAENQSLSSWPCRRIGGIFSIHSLSLPYAMASSSSTIARRPYSHDARRAVVRPSARAPACLGLRKRAVHVASISYVALPLPGMAERGESARASACHDIVAIDNLAKLA